MAGTYLAPDPLLLTALAKGVADLDQDISEVEEYGEKAANGDGGGDADERTHDQGEGPEKRHASGDPEDGATDDEGDGQDRVEAHDGTGEEIVDFLDHGDSL